MGCQNHGPNRAKRCYRTARGSIAAEVDDTRRDTSCGAAEGGNRTGWWLGEVGPGAAGVFGPWRVRLIACCFCSGNGIMWSLVVNHFFSSVLLLHNRTSGVFGPRALVEHHVGGL